MEHIYEKANDQHIAATKIYVKSTDSYAYSDSGKTKKISAADLENLFIKGTVIVDGDTTYKPVSYKTASGVGSLTYVKANSTTATTAVLTLLYSSEYTA